MDKRFQSAILQLATAALLPVMDVVRSARQPAPK